MQSERHSEKFRLTLQDPNSAQPTLYCEYLYMIDTDNNALTLTKQTEELPAVILPTDYFLNY